MGVEWSSLNLSLNIENIVHGLGSIDAQLFLPTAVGHGLTAANQS